MKQELHYFSFISDDICVKYLHIKLATWKLFIKKTIFIFIYIFIKIVNRYIQLKNNQNV